MKKTHLIALLCAFFSILSVKAQPLNVEYQYIGKNNTGTSTAVIPDEGNSGPEAIYIATLQNDTNDVYIERCVITQVDPTNGSPVMAIERDTTNGIERIVATPDRHLLLLSVFLDKLIVTKYDMSLNEIWATELPHSGCLPHRGKNYVDVEIALNPEGGEGNSAEDYYITYPVFSDYTTSANTDLCPKVVRIDQFGNVIWAKVYDNIGTRPSVLQDQACSMTSFIDPESEERRFAICGGYNTFLPGAKLFVFLVDEMGNMTSDYTQITTGESHPFLPDIIADPQAQLLNIVYTEENSGIINPPPAGSGNVSGVGVIQLSLDLLNVLDARYFWHECENYGTSITIASDGDYVIGGWAGKCILNQVPWVASPFFLKINTSLNQVFYKRYNIYTGGGGSQSVHTTDIADYHYIIGQTASYTPTVPPRLLSGNFRLIKADPAGEACEDYDFEMGEIPFEPELDWIKYEGKDDDTWNPVTVPFISVLPIDIACRDAGHKPTDVRQTGNINTHAKVMPTLIRNRSTEQLQCSIQSPVGGNVEIVIHNQVGQEIYRQQQTAVAGNTVISIDAAILATGLNIVRIISNDQVINTSKIVVTD